MVERKGDARAGAVLLRLRRLSDGAIRLLSETVGADGDKRWMEPVPGRDEAELGVYTERSTRIDPDIWVVEIEDRNGRHFLTESVDLADWPA